MTRDPKRTKDSFVGLVDDALTIFVRSERLDTSSLEKFLAFPVFTS